MIVADLCNFEITPNYIPSIQRLSSHENVTQCLHVGNNNFFLGNRAFKTVTKNKINESIFKVIGKL